MSVNQTKSSSQGFTVSHIGYNNKQEVGNLDSKNLKINKVKVKLLSSVRLFVTPWTVAYQASLSMGFSRQEYWSGLPFLSPGDRPDPEIEPRSSAL